MSGVETLISWLNDAYAVEQQLVTTLESHSGDAANYPNLQRRYEEHLRETRRHAEVVKECIERLGGSLSASKTALARMTAAFGALASATASDEWVKNCIADYSMEHFEIASYKALIASAEVLGYDEVVDACRRILTDELKMAEWLDQNLPAVVQEHLAQHATA